MAINPGDYSAIQLAKKRESTFGTPPSGNYKVMNLLPDEGLRGNPGTVRSEEARNDRLPNQRKRVSLDGGGAFNFNMRLGAQFDGFLEEGMCNTFSTPLAISSTAISFQASDNSMNGTGLFGAIIANQILNLGGSASGNTGYVRVVSATANKVILAWLTVTDESVGPTITVTGSALTHGSQKLSATYQRRHTDFSTDPYQVYAGQMVNTLGVVFNFRELIRVSTELMGLMPGARTATPVASGYDTEDTGEVLDVSNNMALHRYDGTISANIRSVEFNWNNNLEYVPVAQSASPDSISLGDISLAGRYSVYVVDGSDLLDDAYADTPVSISWSVQPIDGGAYFFVLPRVKFTQPGDTPKSANRGALMLDLDWEAEPDANNQILVVSKHAA